MNYPFFCLKIYLLIKDEILYLSYSFICVMRIKLIIFYFLSIPFLAFAQKDSLSIGDRYAEDQLYFSVSYSQLFDQPTGITKSNFSYALSGGFIKDIILNKSGTIAIAGGIGLGYDFFNHELKVDEVDGTTVFTNDITTTKNIFKSYNLEFPFELRWRTSNAIKYNFWRIYTGVKFLYNLDNNFQYIDVNSNLIKYRKVSSYNKLQYGLTLSAGYDAFTMNVFYGLSPVFKNGLLNEKVVDTKILKFGLIFYFL